jgi:hypothetical protein
MVEALINENLKFLANVPSNNYFVLSNGRSIANIEELYVAVRDSDESVFYHHVTPDRNDFANWIKKCVLYDQLFNKLIDIKEREVFLGVLAEEIAYLKNPKIAETMKYFSDPEKTEHIEQSSQITHDTTIPPAGKVITQSVPIPSLLPDVQSAAPIAILPSSVAAVPTSIAVISDTNPVNSPSKSESAVQKLAQPMIQSISQPDSQTLVQSTQQLSLQSSVQTDKQPVSQSPTLQVRQPITQTVEQAPVIEAARLAVSTQQQSQSEQPAPIVATQILDEIYDFEQVLKNIIDEIEKDILAWEY